MDHTDSNTILKCTDAEEMHIQDMGNHWRLVLMYDNRVSGSNGTCCCKRSLACQVFLSGG